MHLLHRWSCPWASSEAAPPPDWRGEYAELAVASYLRAAGCRVLRQRFRYGRGGEVDLVCRQGDELVFVEVKSTTSAAAGAPARRLDHAKRELVRRGARRWLMLLGRPVPYRFDMAEVTLFPAQRPVIEYTPRAFTMQEGATHL